MSATTNNNREFEVSATKKNQRNNNRKERNELCEEITVHSSVRGTETVRLGTLAQTSNMKQATDSSIELLRQNG